MRTMTDDEVTAAEPVAEPAREQADDRVAIVDDHRLLADTLGAALSAEGYDVRRIDLPEAGARGALVDAIVRARARVVLLDLTLGHFGDGTALIDPIARAGSRVVVMTDATDRARWGAAIDAGAHEVISKHRPLSDVIETVRLVGRGLRVMAAAERQELVATWRRRLEETGNASTRLSRLTPRERQVLGQLMGGRTVREIATRCFVSEATVRTQVKSILAKLEVSSQLAAVGLAHRVAWRAS